MHPLGVAVHQYAGAFIGGCPGGVDIIDQQNPPRTNSFGMPDNKGISYVSASLCFPQTGLRRRSAPAYQQTGSGDKTPIRMLPVLCEPAGLVKPSLSETRRMQRHRQNQVHITATPEVQEGRQQDFAQRRSQVNLITIFELVDYFSNTGRVEHRRAGAGKMFGPADTFGAAMVQTFPARKYPAANRQLSHSIAFKFDNPVESKSAAAGGSLTPGLALPA